MKLLVFGGTFDPPHNGHISILQNAIQAVKPAKALVVPTGTPPHKQGHSTPPELRLAMCGCFCTLSPTVEISAMEIHRAGKSYTVDTLRELKRQYPCASLYLCMGSDMLLSFTTWRAWQSILQTATLVVQNRTEQDVAPAHVMAGRLQRDTGGRIIFASGIVEEISSTALRAAMAAGEDVSAFLPPYVQQIIRQNHLYQPAGKEPPAL